jgi:hypothetical protein
MTKKRPCTQSGFAKKRTLERKSGTQCFYLSAQIEIVVILSVYLCIGVTKTRFLQIEYAHWSFYDKKDGATVLQRQTPSVVGSIGLKKSQPKRSAK